ncbi:hypothetical protein [uncultured Williamsia sp.]|uniref:hypothetical protein n=1 Tax=uncultured Williamsia sp. TaxID=259311 RepID=UPI00261EDFF0|nr:hypothetical protein [uncultured Williamsia sp.]
MTPMNDYCHLCDSDPCFCGRHGTVDAQGSQAASGRGGPRGIDASVRQFVLDQYDDGVLRNWDGWLDLLADRFGPDRAGVRGVWERVSNQLQRDWLLIDVPDGDAYLRSPSHYPHMRHLSVTETAAEIQALIASGGWTVEEKGLRVPEIQKRIPGVVYISVRDALHHLNERNRLVTTVAPSGKPSQFWYVRRD